MYAAVSFCFRFWRGAAAGRPSAAVVAGGGAYLEDGVQGGNERVVDTDEDLHLREDTADFPAGLDVPACASRGTGGKINNGGGWSEGCHARWGGTRLLSIVFMAYFSDVPLRQTSSTTPRSPSPWQQKQRVGEGSRPASPTDGRSLTMRRSDEKWCSPSMPSLRTTAVSAR